jgi:uncharacterized protein YbjQ (UPF0145 family)
MLWFLFLLALGIIFGRLNERRHYERLRADEAALAHIPVYTLKSVPQSHAEDLAPGGVLVSGNVVIAIDYFKRIMAVLRMIVGGRLGAYETLMDRARREAVVRMKQEAADLGAQAVYNLRVEFSMIGQQPQMSGAELLAYGTAVRAKA